MTSNNGSNERTCLCLNVRICPRQTSTTAPSHDGADPDYVPCFVGDDGISIVHPQLTLRSRSPGVPIPNSSQCGRYATLSCLVCSTPIYRVYQVAPLNTQSMSGPLLPSDDWSETDALKSPDGWIEVHRHCSPSASPDVREWSTSMSSLFKIHLPPPTVAMAPTASTSLLPSSVQAPPRSASPSPPVPFLTKLRPIFLPAPFTPSHPVFAHLAAIATEKSQSMRRQAEEELAAILQKKISEIEQAEKSLRDEVETIWRVFRQNVDSAAAAAAASHAITTTSVPPAISNTNTSFSTATAAVSSDSEVNAAHTRSASHSADIDPHASQLASPTRGTAPTPGLTRQENFEPSGVSIAPRREPAPSQHAAHRSSLSASLVASPLAMHAALGGGGSASVQRQNQPSLHRRTSSSPRSSTTSATLTSGSTTADTDTDVSTLVDPLLPVTDMREEPFRRNMDPHRDMSASILVFTLEAEMAQRAAKQRAAMVQSAPSEGAANNNQVSAGPSNAGAPDAAPGVDHDSAATPSANTTNGHTKQNGKDKEPAVGESSSDSKARSKEQINKGSLKSPRSPDVKNGKRKVTFDIKPEIREVGPTTTSSAQDEREQQQIVISSAKPEADMVFPFEEEHVDHDVSTAPSSPPTPRATSYRLVEHPQAPTRVSTSRKNPIFLGGLPASFSGLRPESLPTMASGSRLRRRMSPPSRLPSALASSSSPKQQRTQGTTGEEGHSEEEEDSLFSPQEEELRKLFAADMPSHRSAWARGSKSWRKSKGKSIDDGSHDEDDEYDARHYDAIDYPVASSLPVSMRQPSRARVPLSLSSYTPETLLAHNVPPSVAAQPAGNNMRGLPSSVAIRKAAYNERDRLRSMDPGALDFVVDEEDEEGEDDDDSSTVMHDEGGNDGDGSRRQKVISPGDRGRQRALRILQKRNELPAAGLWRSLA